MAYRVLIDGIPVLCETPEEATRLARSVARDAGNGKSNRALTTIRRELRQKICILLQKIVNSGSSGIASSRLAKELKTDARGFGPMVMVLKQELGDLTPPRSINDVLERIRKDDKRYWTGKEIARDVLNTLVAKFYGQFAKQPKSNS